MMLQMYSNLQLMKEFLKIAINCIFNKIKYGDIMAITQGKSTRSPSGARNRANREKINHHPILSNDIKLQMSIGMAFSEQSVGKTESLYIEADKNMYEEKKQRRKRNRPLCPTEG